MSTKNPHLDPEKFRDSLATVREDGKEKLDLSQESKRQILPLENIPFLGFVSHIIS
jgi:hypothetical protein